MANYRNGHLKSELKKKYAGKIVPNPHLLPHGTFVTLFEKGTKNWWEHGEVIVDADGTTKITTYDGVYEPDVWEVYLDSRYKYKDLEKRFLL